MKGRMFVVNEETLISTKNTLIASIITPQPTGVQWLKTISDIMADMLQIEIGDYIFLWETRSNTQKSRIHGVYRAISKPFYKCDNSDDNAPFKIHIEKAYDFEFPLDEYDVLNCPYIKNPLWTIIGKKVAGKSRGTSPLSQDEIKALITLLIDKNPNYTFYNFNDENCIPVTNELKINLSNRGNNANPSNLSALIPNNLNFLNNSGDVHYEKIIETLFNQELSNKNKAFFSQLGINVDKVIWFSNYLPYSIEQSEMDYVIIESDDKFSYSKIFVLEFMKGRIDDSHIIRNIMYSKWVNDTIALGTKIVQPILICNNSYDFINGETDRRKINKYNQLNSLFDDTEKEYNSKPVKVFEYDFSGTSPVFKKKR